MNSNFCYLLFLLALFTTLGYTSCTSDKLPEPEMIEIGFCDTIPATYTLNVGEIIDQNCAYSGCHIAGTGAPGDFSTFGGLQGVINEGKFEEHVVVLKDDPEFGMPPYYVPDGKPEDLTEEQFNIMLCWIEAGFPEN